VKSRPAGNTRDEFLGIRSDKVRGTPTGFGGPSALLRYPKHVGLRAATDDQRRSAICPRATQTDAEKTKPRRAATLRGSAAIAGGDGGIRTLDPGFGPDAPLAGECLRPLGHVSQTFGRAGSQRDEAKMIAGRTAKVNVCGTFFVPDLSSTTQFFHVDRAKRTERFCTPRCLQQITLDRARTPYAARARRAPCTSRRSAQRS
jgi:hypothetical protein